jgi:hypothetical protein
MSAWASQHDPVSKQKSVIPALRRLRQEDYELKASLVYVESSIVRPYFKQTNENLRIKMW